MAAALSALVEIICVERIANALSMVLYIYDIYILVNIIQSYVLHIFNKMYIIANHI